MLNLDQGTFKPGPHCSLERQKFFQPEAKMRFGLLGLVGAVFSAYHSGARAKLSLVRAT
jgi:hypothetical protein